MIAIIPLAGRSERFTDAGYTVPKWALPLRDGRSMLATVVQSLGGFSELTLITRREYDAAVASCLSESDSKWYVKNNDMPTTGPMETILCAKDYLKTSDELLISYCDCFASNGLADFLAAMRSSSADAGVYCFRSNNPRFQYDPTGEYALGGIFWFRHADEFLRRSRKFPIRPDLSPAHVAFSYKGIGSLDGYKLYLDTAHYVDVGTPEDYERYIGKVTEKAGDAVDASGLPVFESFDAFMASDALGAWRKDEIGFILYRSVTKQPVTEDELRRLAADMQRTGN